ncbi:farnesol dehydrogenase-like [Teleopsis dalmanni]|uniref:farnesol dehydrogenase-like n=1 Tax=Teleopsis dalmanni TaxID=139649 RepID=UPI0018CEC1FE|nr:farnesol dehydrogenase-like [Teleopsis dalmanni]
MQRWRGKIAVVTGASSGIGWCVTKDLIDADMFVVGLARRVPQMEKLRLELEETKRENFYPHECDLGSLSSIQAAFAWIEERFKKVHVLINNAGMSEHSKLLDEGNEELLKRNVDVNLNGTIFCTKAAYRLMKIAMNAGEECNIINVNSLLGHQIPLHIPDCGLNIYPVTKHALLAANDVLRRELYEHKLMRLCTISPGLTQTNFGATAFDDKTLRALPTADDILQPEDVSRGVVFILSSPLHVTIADLVMLPSREKY